MLDFIVFFFWKYGFLLATLLFLIKVYLFMKYKNENWKGLYFFYFSQDSIEYSSDDKRVKLKRIQNQLSIAILLSLVLNIIFSQLL